MTSTSHSAGGSAVPLSVLTTKISKLAKKRHDHVMRDARKMLSDLGKDENEFSAVAYLRGPNSEARGIRAFRLPKREALILLAGYSAKLCADVFDIWEEAEAVRRDGDVSSPAL